MFTSTPVVNTMGFRGAGQWWRSRSGLHTVAFGMLGRCGTTAHPFCCPILIVFRP